MPGEVIDGGDNMQVVSCHGTARVDTFIPLCRSNTKGKRMKSKKFEPVSRGGYFLYLFKNRREMLGMIKSEFVCDLFDREGGGCKENLGFQDNMVQDGFLGGKTGVLFYQGIQMIGMSMESVGVKAH
jgi:hypothetical protein